MERRRDAPVGYIFLHQRWQQQHARERRCEGAACSRGRRSGPGLRRHDQRGAGVACWDAAARRTGWGSGGGGGGALARGRGVRRRRQRGEEAAHLKGLD